MASGDPQGPESGPAATLAVDRLVHEPARMAILSVLEGVQEADFVFLQRILGLTNGNLSAHLTKLETAGLITATKGFVQRTPRTTLAITPQGREARRRHWEQLEQIHRLAR